MKCPNCHFENEPRARFCAKCGSAIQINNYPTTDNTMKINCPSCGTPNNPDRMLCENCGARIGQQTATGNPQVSVQTTPKRISAVWWLLPILLGWVGGLVAWIIIREIDKAKAKSLFIVGIVITVVWILLYVVVYRIISCSPTVLTPGTTYEYEQEIATDFTTFTSEGLFSISYPSDWTPALSDIEALWYEVKDFMETNDPEIYLDDWQMLFLAGMPTQDLDGLYPNVNIGITARSMGYWSLDEIVEWENSYSMDSTSGYREISQIRTVVDGREAIITDSEDNEPGWGRWRYLQMYTVNDDFVWIVTCSSEYQDFDKFADTFESIVRSLRIFN